MRRLLIADAVRSADAVLGDAVVVDGTQIEAVGRAEDFRGPDLQEERWTGATILSGLRDAHLHPVGYAAALQRPSLKEATDFSDLSDVLAEALRAQAPGTALTGLRLDDEGLAEQRLPDRSLLDAISAESPILLMRYCGHIAVANTAALELAGIDADSPDPPGGVIDRDDLGIPTGVLRETAFEPVTAAVRPLAPPITTDHVSSALAALASTGITGIGAMAATDSGLWGGAESELDVLLEGAANSPITISVFVIAASPDSLRRAAGRIADAGPRVRFAGVKMFSDGSLGGHTAAMHHGFADEPAETGTDRLDPSWAEDMARAALDLEARVAIHAIGDRANGTVLDLMARLIDEGADPGALRIEHASVLTEADITRFGQLGVTASIQPAFIASETDWLEKRLGSDRLQRTYPFRSLVEAGAPIGGGSDSPVEPPHPLHGMAASIDRCGVVPEQGLTATEALQLFTTGSARATGEDASLAPGSPATLTVIDTDPATSSADQIRSAEVLATFVAGDEATVPSDTIAWQA